MEYRSWFTERGEAMNVSFTTLDGEVWVNKKHMIDIIEKTLKDIYPTSTKRRFADLLIGYLGTLYYKGNYPPIKEKKPNEKKHSSKSKGSGI